MTNGRWTSIPNRISALRLAALPLLWVLAIAGLHGWLAIGLAVAALTDVIDGIIARHSGAATEFGARLDSVADHLLTISTVIWLVMLRPDFFVRERVPLLLWSLLALMVLAVGWMRFRRFGGLHLLSAKIAGSAGYIFAIWVIAYGTYAAAAFHAVLLLATLSAVESLLVFLTAREVDENRRSILLAPRRDRTGGGR